MKHIVFIYGLCGIGKTSLLRTFGPRTTHHELAPQIPAGIKTFAVDKERADAPAQKAGVIIEKINEGLVAVDIPQMHIKYYKDFEPLDGSVHHILLDEKEEVVREGLRRRNPERDLEKAMREREALRRKASSYGWPIMSQNEIADFRSRSGPTPRGAALTRSRWPSMVAVGWRCLWTERAARR